MESSELCVWAKCKDAINHACSLISLQKFPTYMKRAFGSLFLSVQSSVSMNTHYFFLYCAYTCTFTTNTYTICIMHEVVNLASSLAPITCETSYYCSPIDTIGPPSFGGRLVSKLPNEKNYTTLKWNDHTQMKKLHHTQMK